MNPTVATVCVTGIALTLGLAVWILYRGYQRAEARLQHVISTQLAAATTHRDDHQARSRAIDEEYRQLVLNAHNADD